METYARQQALKKSEQKRKDDFTRRELLRQEAFRAQRRKEVAKLEKQVASDKEKARKTEVKRQEKEYREMMKKEEKELSGKFERMG